MWRVTDAETLPEYRIRVRFQDGVEGIVDLSDMVGIGVCADWNDPTQFARMFIDHESGTVAWPNGIDLAPEVLYQDCLNAQATKTPSEVAP